jgi:hypothetical protein
MRNEVAFLKTQFSSLKKSPTASVQQTKPLELQLKGINVNDVSKLSMLVDTRTITPFCKSINLKDANGNTITGDVNRLFSKMMTDSITQMKVLGLANSKTTHPMVHPKAMEKMAKISQTIISQNSDVQVDMNDLTVDMELGSAACCLVCALGTFLDCTGKLCYGGCIPI